MSNMNKNPNPLNPVSSKHKPKPNSTSKNVSIPLQFNLEELKNTINIHDPIINYDTFKTNMMHPINNYSPEQLYAHLKNLVSWKLISSPEENIDSAKNKRWLIHHIESAYKQWCGIRNRLLKDKIAKHNQSFNENIKKIMNQQKQQAPKIINMKIPIKKDENINLLSGGLISPKKRTFSEQKSTDISTNNNNNSMNNGLNNIGYVHPDFSKRIKKYPDLSHGLTPEQV